MNYSTLRLSLPPDESFSAVRDRLAEFTSASRRSVELTDADSTPHVVGGHSRYTASRAPQLRPLDDLLTHEELAAFEPVALEQCRWEGRLYQVPLAQETRLLYYRADFFDSRIEQERFREASGGRELRVPRSWEELAAVAQYFALPGTRCGFAYPGRGPGLLQSFAEIVETVGGTCFDVDGRPRFYSRAGEWALSLLRDLLLRWEAVPPETPDLDESEVSEAFRLGRIALACDRSGTGRLLCDPSFSAVAGWHGVAKLPCGPGERRAVWSGSPALAIPADSPDPEAALELIRFLTSDEHQVEEARHGVFPSRTAARRQTWEVLRDGTLAARRFRLAEETLAESALTAPAVPRFGELEAAVWPFLREAITGAVEVVPALEQAHRACEALLECGE